MRGYKWGTSGICFLNNATKRSSYGMEKFVEHWN